MNCWSTVYVSWLLLFVCQSPTCRKTVGKIDIRILFVRQMTSRSVGMSSLLNGRMGLQMSPHSERFSGEEVKGLSQMHA